ncbi:hypothetical protein [Streptomyces sp. NPDC002851]
MVAPQPARCSAQQAARPSKSVASRTIASHIASERHNRRIDIRQNTVGTACKSHDLDVHVPDQLGLLNGELVNTLNGKTSAMSETTCMRQSKTVHTDKHGRYVIKQTQECATTSRPHLPLPNDNALSTGAKKIEPIMDCSNKVQLPKGFKRPHFAF